MELSGFVQEGPHLGNQFLDDATLISFLKRLLPEEVFVQVSPDLGRFGWDVANTIKALGQQAEAEPPRLVSLDGWTSGTPTVLSTSNAWTQLKGIAAQKGLVSLPYERPFGPHSRIYQLAKLYLFGASSGLTNCPLAMADGAARVCQLLLAECPELAVPLAGLTSRSAGTAWTSGQWMTERKGGSDVAGGTETIAVPLRNTDQEDLEERRNRNGTNGSTSTNALEEAENDLWYRLYGKKWFSSAADGEMALALAREVEIIDINNTNGTNGNIRVVDLGLSLFYVPLIREAPPTSVLLSGVHRGRQLQTAPEGVHIETLKDKLGTRQLPTAELRLEGVRGLKIGPTGRGVAGIAAMVNVTRVHNCAAAASFMRRVTALAQDYGRRRTVFSKKLIEHPLAVRTLAWMEVHTAAALGLTLELGRLMGLVECGVASPSDSRLLRLLTPAVKAFTAKEAVAVASEGLEAFGGQGYIESTGLPGILRDAQVLPIWEGTTNVLSLDVLRVVRSDPQVCDAYASAIESCLVNIPREIVQANGTAGSGTIKESLSDTLSGKVRKKGAKESRHVHAVHVAQEILLVKTASHVRKEAIQIVQTMKSAALNSEEWGGEGLARNLLLSVGQVMAAGLLLQQAGWSRDSREVLIAVEWCREVLGMSMEGTGGGVDGQGRWDAAVVAAAVARAGQPLSAPRARF